MYTLTATNPYGWRSKSITVTVSSIPIIDPQVPMVVIKPDLQPTFITRQSLNSYTAHIKNNGAIGSVACKIQLNSGASIIFIDCPPIAAGGTANVPFSYAQQASCGGGAVNFDITIFVDSASSINETDEGNNRFTRTFTCS
jgi:hypothetical protein